MDYSSHDFYVDSNGEVANYPRFYRQSEEKLAKEQRKLSRMKVGSDKNLTSHDGTPFSKSIGKKFVAVQRLTQLKMLEFQSKPHCWESECRSLFVATAKAKNIRLVFEANGKEMQVQYPVSNLITFEMIKKKVISTWAIAPRKLSNEVKEFLAENCADYSKYWSDIPMKAVSRIESGRKVLWKNPIFEETKK